MSESVRICENCGARHIKVMMWSDGAGKSFWFCSLKCKQEFVQTKYPEMVRKQDEEKDILPQVRSLVARKDKQGRITVVRRYSGVRGGTTEGEDRHKGSGSS